MKKIVNRVWTQRIMLFLAAVALLTSGLREMLRGDFHYANYWGGVVFAPVAILVGAGLLAAIVLDWKAPGKPRKEPKLKGRAARLARKAEQTTFPIDDYKKW
jgi:hypothetical protein